jgi:hypothetical protein
VCGTNSSTVSSGGALVLVLLSPRFALSGGRAYVFVIYVL